MTQKEGPMCPMFRKHSWDCNADLGFASVCLSHAWIDGLGNCVSVMSLTGFSFISSSERQSVIWTFSVWTIIVSCSITILPHFSNQKKKLESGIKSTKLCI